MVQSMFFLHTICLTRITRLVMFLTYQIPREQFPAFRGRIIVIHDQRPRIFFGTPLEMQKKFSITQQIPQMTKTNLSLNKVNVSFKNDSYIDSYVFLRSVIETIAEDPGFKHIARFSWSFDLIVHSSFEQSPELEILQHEYYHLQILIPRFQLQYLLSRFSRVWFFFTTLKQRTWSLKTSQDFGSCLVVVVVVAVAVAVAVGVGVGCCNELR